MYAFKECKKVDGIERKRLKISINQAKKFCIASLFSDSNFELKNLSVVWRK